MENKPLTQFRFRCHFFIHELPESTVRRSSEVRPLLSNMNLHYSQRDEIVKYASNFIVKFKENCVNAPARKESGLNRHS